jgi:hypothetical protein
MESLSIQKFHTTLAVTLLVFATSCFAPRVGDYERTSAVNRIMNSWVGHYQSELITYWGPPTDILPNEKGGSILVYESLKGTWGDVKDKRIEGGAQYTTGPRQPGYAAKRVFYVNQEGIIYAWKWSGL